MNRTLTFEPEPFLELPNDLETLDSYEAEFDSYGEAEVDDKEFLDSELGDEAEDLEQESENEEEPAHSGAAKPAAELVRFAQRVLNASEGERLTDDGDLGRLTRGALERFRGRYGLGAGGVLDAQTTLALTQRALEELAQQSIFAQPGVFDAKTEQSLVAFKAKRGLGLGTTLDAATRAALVEALVRGTSSSQDCPTQPQRRVSTPAAMSDTKRGQLIAAALTQATTEAKPEARKFLVATLKATDTDPATWFGDIVPDATFLGRRLGLGGEVPGVHRKLLDRLNCAESMLLLQYPGQTAEQLGTHLGIYSMNGLRAPAEKKRQSLHSFGLATDINHPTNPYIGNNGPKPNDPKYDDDWSPSIIGRAMLLLHGEKFNVEKALKTTDGKPLSDIKDRVAGAWAAWHIHKRASETLAEYLRLADDVNGQRVQEFVGKAHDKGNTKTLEWWKKRIERDRKKLKTFDFMHHRNPERCGYMDLKRDLVVALVGAGLQWGGMYNGKKDMMHFELLGIIQYPGDDRIPLTLNPCD